MNGLNFEPEQIKDLFAENTRSMQLSLKASSDASASSSLDMIKAMQATIDIMMRQQSDRKNNSPGVLSTEELSEIGDYALNLLEQLSIVAANMGMQDSMIALQRLSLPVAYWLIQQGGEIGKLDILVNALSGLANTITENLELERLSRLIAQIIAHTSNDIRQDLEQTNPMRPWRIINLNWGIVATRSHNAELMDNVFEQLVKNIPVDAKAFFTEGMQQMDIIGYPDHVRKVMEKYSKQWSHQGKVH
ncbi:MAG: hypothetical protein ACN4GM_07830 [Gammaproteobacteria bacterium]